MCGGGGGDTEQRPTDQDVAAQQAAEGRLRNYARDFLPLEQQAVDQAFNPSTQENRRSSLRGRVNADVMQKAGEDRQGLAAAIQQGRGVTGVADVNDDVSTAKSSAFKDADALASEEQTQDQLNVVRTGQGKSRVALSGLHQNAARASQQAAAKLESNMIDRRSRASVVNQMVGNGLRAAGAYQNNQTAQDLNQVSQGNNPQVTMNVDKRMTMSNGQMMG